jgi:meckelin
LLYFIDVAVLFAVSSVYYTIRRLLVRFVPTDLHNFVDLCSIANISIFFFDSPLHGYYIHGKNPMDKSDANLQEMIVNIQKESVDQTKKRGLDPNQDL